MSDDELAEGFDQALIARLDTEPLPIVPIFRLVTPPKRRIMFRWRWAVCYIPLIATLCAASVLAYAMFMAMMAVTVVLSYCYVALLVM